MDLTGYARALVSQTYAPYELFISAVLIYLGLTFIVTRLLNLTEYRLNPHMRPLQL